MVGKILKANHKVFYTLVILVTYVFTTFFLTPYTAAVKAVTYSYGSTGGPVIELQTRLKRWGYYNGTIDGVYGYRTFTAVKYFQSKNGLTADGVAGNQTLAALGFNIGNTGTTTTSTTSTTSNSNVWLLARVINGEARGEPYEGQVAVGAVILNRTRDSRFPSTIAGVIYQPGAFTATVDGQIDANVEQSSINAARDALNGWDPSGGAIYYYNPAKTTNAWIWSRPVITVIGSHKFCK
ncbi:MAG: spore cortex-lytic enzyme [Bacillota bacterium]|nr:spore cortex-lytic enzyme [Bacillota bacterium]